MPKVKTKRILIIKTNNKMENQNKENENNGFWSPSVRLRYIEKCIYSNEFSARYEKVLQQLYTSDTGIQEWREIQLESE